MPISSGPRLTILGGHEEQLREWLTGHPDGHERAALVLLRCLNRWGELPDSPRYVVVDVVLMTEEWIISSSPTHIDFHKAGFHGLYHRCEKEGLVLGFVHNHPGEVSWFSERDDKNESLLVRRLAGVNGPASKLVAMLLWEGKWFARIRNGFAPDSAAEVRHVAVLGDRLDVHTRMVNEEEDDDVVLARQEAAFGRPFNKKIRSLRICVVGAGGTGSPTATLLARAGAGEIIIIDGDDLEDTNLNRVRGARTRDVGKNKARILADYINELEVGCSAYPIEGYLQTPEALDALSTADVIFGCTDNELSRDVLNLALYHHAQVLIDTGLGGNIELDEDGHPYLYTHSGRVNTLLPQFGRCLYCHGAISEAQIKYEEAVQHQPKLSELSAEELLDKHYLTNSGGEQSPGVGPFTSAVADLAVGGLFDLIKPYRKFPDDVLRDCVRQSFVEMKIYSNGPADRDDCSFCQQGVFTLKDEAGNRLGRPALGRIDVGS